MPAPREQKSVSLRPLPHPYRAALAIHLDCEGLSPALYHALMSFLCTEAETPYGRGLGLEIAGSLWVCASDPSAISLLTPENGLSRAAGALATLCRSGWIDTLHGLGDFSEARPCTRDYARFAYDTLAGLDIHLPVWTNYHGLHQRQNFGSRKHPDYEGDLPDASCYHADFAAAYGLRYYGWDERVSHPLSAARPGLFLPALRAAGLLCRNSLTSSPHRRPPAVLSELVTPVSLRDGTSLLAFTRYEGGLRRHIQSAGREIMAGQFTRLFLEGLKHRQGFAVATAKPAFPAWEHGQPFFDGYGLAALHRLRHEVERKEILLAATSRLLHYHMVHRRLSWSVETRLNGEQVITLHGLDDPLTGFRQPVPEELEGLAFRMPQPERAKVELAGRTVPHFEVFHEEGRQAGDKSRGGLHIPWRRLSPPPNGFALPAG